MIPENIGRYQVKAEIGRGGMATVYQAYDPRFEREVAIKVLPREMLHDPQFRIRFEREAKTIAMLEHPAIVPVYDFGEEDGQPFFVMRYMTGGSLADRMRPGPMSVAEAVRIFQRLAPALDQAHAKKIIHRDLKPGNILFDQYGEPYISDFGIAKLSETPTSVTGSAIIGTPAYMSPEQARGEPVDSRADIYALGIILFEILTGRQPFEGDTPMSVVIKHITDPVPHILDIKPDLPTEIEPVIEKAMAKDKDKRFPNTQAFADALSMVALGERPDLQPAPTKTVPAQPAPAETVRSPKPAGIPAASRPKRTGLWVGLGLAGLLVVAAVTVAVLFLPSLLRAAASPTATSSLPPTVTVRSVEAATPQPTSTSERQTPTAGEPPPAQPARPVLGGADLIAFVSANNIWVMNVDSSDLRQLTTDGGAKHDLQFSPDGLQVIFVSGRRVQAVEIESGTVTTLAEFPAADYLEGFAISPDGNQVAISLNRELYLVPFDLEALDQARYHTDLAAMEGCFTYTELATRSVEWSNDSQRIAVGIIGVNDTRTAEMVRLFDITNCDSANPVVLDTFPGPRFTMSGYNDNLLLPSFDWDGATLFLVNSSRRNDGFGNLYNYNYESHRAENLDPLGSTCCYRDARWSPDGTYVLLAYQDINQGVGSTTQLYYIPFTSIGTGTTYTPLRLPPELFANPRERPQPALRPARP
ncbi:MAG: protein kinase [Anaerolineales bacterium]|nr:protein kinase [Anaerolineales bacterium]